MATAFPIIMLLVILSRSEPTESKSASFENGNSLKREQLENIPTDDECDLRRPDGTCHNQWRVGKKESIGSNSLETRQAICNRITSLNCRIMLGKKRDSQNIDFTRPDGRRSLLCRTKNFKGMMDPDKPCKKRTEDSEKIYMYKSALKIEDLRNKQTKKCDLKSPFCFAPFPGKRKPISEEESEKRGWSSPIPKQSEEVDHKDSVTVTKNGLLRALFVTTKLLHELNGEDGQEEQVAEGYTAADDSKPKCDPKRDFQCRFRILGRREQIFSKPAVPKPYKYDE